MDNFYKAIALKFIHSLNNQFYDNYDFNIRKIPRKVKFKLLIEKYLNFFLQKAAPNASLIIFNKNYFIKNIEQYEFLYNLLADKRSKEKYIEILSYKMLGFNRVKLSLNNDGFWEIRKKIKLYKSELSIPVNFRSGKLYLYNLKEIGYDLSIYFIPNGIVTDFVLQQYNYEDIVKVNRGDTVIDCGGCWGDTALYFASMGAKQVYVYEFIPSNITILQKNLDINPKFKKLISLINKAVWNESNIKLSYRDKGPASLVDEVGKYDNDTKTLSIDDLVHFNKIEQVNFIKMDIEGAEIPALHGAVNTIIRDKPKLAISVYHKPDDLIRIPELINSIRDDYKFYFDYYTIIGDEAILYAI